MGTHRQKVVHNSFLTLGFAADKNSIYMSYISKWSKKGNILKNFQDVTQWRFEIFATVFCHFYQRWTLNLAKHILLTILYMYNIMDKVWIPLPEINIWHDAVKVFMSHSDKGEFGKRYKITNLVITFLFANGRKI